MQAKLNALKTFDFTSANLNLWVYKNSTAPRRYNALYVQTDVELAEQFRNIARSEMVRISEIAGYGHLAENNEISCLLIDESNTDFAFLKTQVDRPEPDCAAEGANDLKGAAGYVVKFSFGGVTVYAVRRTVSSWRTKFPKRFINVIFKNGELAAAEDDAFTIERTFDFFVMNGAVFVINKKAFETVLQHRVAYAASFAMLQSDVAFAPLFQDMQPLVDYVGTNPMHLRRMTAITQKNLFADPTFLRKLQTVSNNRNWGINFDPVTNKIVVCNITAKTVIDVLLDHHLMSEVTANSYLVPDATLQP